jgi:outer membrane protein
MFKIHSIQIPILIAVACFLFTTALSAQQASQVLTLQDCIRLAGSAPSPVSIARKEHEIAAREISRVRAGFLPQSQLASGFTYNSPLLYNRELNSLLPLNGIQEYTFLFNVSQEFDTSGRLRTEMSRARISQELAATGIALTERDLKRAVTASYYRALLARRIVRIVQEALLEGQSFEKRARLLFEGGEAAQADVIKASAQAANFQQALSAAQLEEKLAEQELASFWTRDVAQPLALADVFDETPPAPVAESPQSASFLKRPEFSLFDVQRKVFQIDAKRARADTLPQLGVAFQYGIDSTALRFHDRGYAAFVNLTIPVFDWNKSRSATQQARLKEQQTEQARSMSERAFSKEYQNALARVKHLFEQISLTLRQAKLAEDDLRLSRIRYEGGEGSALDVVTAQNQLAQARTNHYTTIANYLNAKADLEVASGQ